MAAAKPGPPSRVIHRGRLIGVCVRIAGAPPKARTVRDGSGAERLSVADRVRFSFVSRSHLATLPLTAHLNIRIARDACLEEQNIHRGSVVATTAEVSHRAVIRCAALLLREE